MIDILFISEKKIKEASTLNDNLWGKYLLPAIKTAQEINLMPILGEKLYDKLQVLIYERKVEDEENINYKVLLDKFITPYLTYQVLANLIPDISVKLSNAGTITTTDEHIQNLSKGDRDLLQEKYQNTADAYSYKLIDFLKNNSKDFPEIDECNFDDKSGSNTGIWLGGMRGKRVIGL